MKWLLSLLLFVSINYAYAASSTQPLQRGSYQKIIAAHAGKPFIVALWSISCTHCGADLELLDQLARKYYSFNLVLISTDTPEAESVISRTLKHYHLLPESYKRPASIESWVFADSFAERLRFEVDAHWYGELPRTYFYDADGKGRGVSGVLDAKETENWIRSNSKP